MDRLQKPPLAKKNSYPLLSLAVVFQEDAQEKRADAARKGWSKRQKVDQHPAQEFQEVEQ